MLIKLSVLTILIEIITLSRKFNYHLYYNNAFIITAYIKSVINIKKIFSSSFNFLILLRTRLLRFLIAI